MSKDRGSFSHIGFILAAAGSAIGLGNLWKFPYIAYENNGGSFVLIYLLTILIVGFPIMMAEIVIGRATQKSPVSAFLKLGHPAWSGIGWLGIGTGFVILSYYSVVAGWTVHYFLKCMQWSFTEFTPEIANNLGPYFGNFLQNGPMQVGFHLLFIIFSMSVVIFGINKGIERLARILMPVLFLILVGLLVNSFFTPGFKPAMQFLFRMNKITADGILEAAGHAFFSLSLGMGAIITYGSYMNKKESIPKAAGLVCIMDTLIALVACFIMCSIIFSVSEAERASEFSQSMVIMFTTLPKMFYNLPAGQIFAPLFFLLVSFAALTSTISLLEVVVAFFIDHLKWDRIKSTLLAGLLIFGTGVLAALSLGANGPLSKLNPFGGRSEGVFDTLDYLASNWFLPVGGIFISLFVGWIMDKKLKKMEMETGHGPVKYYKFWIFLLRFICPAAVGWIIYAVIFMGKTFN